MGRYNADACIVTGALTNGDNVRLDETLPLQSARVRVVIEPLRQMPAHITLVWTIEEITP